jgi:hypothetical protein
MTEAQGYNLPFDEAVAFFREKVNVPTGEMAQLAREEYARSFSVSGVANADLLADIRSAVDQAISSGTTLRDFQKEFPTVAARYGWLDDAGAGYKNWRASIIFNENVSQAYRAGRFRQMTSPAVRAARPYFRYTPSSSAVPRPDHMLYYNLVLPAEHPFWLEHFPPIPGAFGCKCGAQNLSPEEVDELISESAGSEFPVHRSAPDAAETTAPPPGIPRPDLAPPDAERMAELETDWRAADEAEKELIEKLDSYELNQLILEQRALQEGLRPDHEMLKAIEPELPGESKFYCWVSNNGHDAYKWRAMIPEKIAEAFYQVPEAKLNELWVQGGKEWHHVQVRTKVVIIRERYYRIEDLEQWARLHNPQYKAIYFEKYPKPAPPRRRK